MKKTIIIEIYEENYFFPASLLLWQILVLVLVILDLKINNDEYIAYLSQVFFHDVKVY